MLLDSELGPRVRIPTLLPTFRLQRAPRRPPSVPLQPELHRSLLPSPGPAERACPALRSPLVPNREAISKVINIHCAGPASPDRVALLLALTQLPRAAEGHRGSPQPQSLPGARRDHAARAAPLPRAPGQPLPRRPRVLCTGRIDVKQRRIPGEGRETLMPPLHTLPERKPNKLQVPVHREKATTGARAPGDRSVLRGLPQAHLAVLDVRVQGKARGRRRFTARRERPTRPPAA